MAVLDIGRPAAQEPVQVLRDQLRPQPQPAPPGQVPDPVTGVLHGPVRGPAGQERHPRFPARPPRADQPVVEAEEINPLASCLQMDDAGLGRLRPQAQPGQQVRQPRHATDRIVAPPYRASDAGLRPGPFPDRAASLLPGLLAATRTGLTPAGDDELTNSKIRCYVTASPPALLGARKGLSAVKGARLTTS